MTTPGDPPVGDLLADTALLAWEATDGYGSGTTELWDADDRLLAIAHQTARRRPLAKGERLPSS